MNNEQLHFTIDESFKNNQNLGQKETDILNSEIIESQEFDLSVFFEEDTEGKHENNKENAEDIPGIEQQPLPDLLITLKNVSNESITTITSKVTAETFKAGVSMTSTVFSALSSLVGSCGVFCAHSLGSLGQAGSNLAVNPGFSGIQMPNFGIDSKGNFHLKGNVDSLSKVTGISKSDLLSGKLSAENIFSTYFSIFGEGLGLTFGFGLVDKFIGCIFDCILPQSNNTTELPATN